MPQRKQEAGDLGMAKYEIPQLLLQANMAFNYDKGFEEYEAFVISIEGYTNTHLPGLSCLHSISEASMLASLQMAA